MISACAVVMLEMLGLATDFGRIYIAKSEVQQFVDSASIAAASAFAKTRNQEGE